MDNQGTNSPPTPSPEFIEERLKHFKYACITRTTMLSNQLSENELSVDLKLNDGYFKDIDINKFKNLIIIYQGVLFEINKAEPSEDRLKELKAEVTTEFKKIDKNQKQLFKESYRDNLKYLNSAKNEYYDLQNVVDNLKLPEGPQYIYPGYQLDKLPEGYKEESNLILHRLGYYIKKVENSDIMNLARFIEVDKIEIYNNVFSLNKSADPNTQSTTDKKGFFGNPFNLLNKNTASKQPTTGDKKGFFGLFNKSTNTPPTTGGKRRLSKSSKRKSKKSRRSTRKRRVSKK